MLRQSASSCIRTLRALEAAVAGLSADPFRHFLLHQQHQPLIRRIHGTIEASNQPFEQWAGDVVRNVGHDFRGQATIRERQRGLEHIPLACR